MKKIISIFLLMNELLLGSINAENSQQRIMMENDQSQMAAWMLEASVLTRNYLEALDKEEYSQCWTCGDPLFQCAIQPKEWMLSLRQSRTALGKMKVRKLKGQRVIWNPPELPAGPYMTVDYETFFEKKPQARERLILRRGSDNQWHPLIYQID